MIGISGLRLPQSAVRPRSTGPEPLPVGPIFRLGRPIWNVLMTTRRNYAGTMFTRSLLSSPI